MRAPQSATERQNAAPAKRVCLIGICAALLFVLSACSSSDISEGWLRDGLIEEGVPDWAGDPESLSCESGIDFPRDADTTCTMDGTERVNVFTEQGFRPIGFWDRFFDLTGVSDLDEDQQVEMTYIIVTEDTTHDVTHVFDLGETGFLDRVSFWFWAAIIFGIIALGCVLALRFFNLSAADEGGGAPAPSAGVKEGLTGSGQTIRIGDQVAARQSLSAGALTWVQRGSTGTVVNINRTLTGPTFVVRFAAGTIECGTRAITRI